MQDSSTDEFPEGLEAEPGMPVRDNSISQRHLDNMQKRRDEARAALMAIPGIEREVVWEIGCGHGHFLTGYSQANPEKICVGVDIILDRVERGLRKRDRAELNTLHFVRTEATMFLDVLPETTQFSAVFILFPDPWPKKRHHKNRLLQAPFMARLATRCKPGTPFHFRTDFAPYFADVVEMLRTHPDWQLRDDLPWPYELETVFQKRAEGSYQSLIATRR